MVEASRLMKPEPLLKTAWIKKGAFVVPYGTMSAVELSLTDIMSKMVVDDWGQCKGGQFGSLRAHVEAGKLSEQTLHAEFGQIVAGLKPGRERDDETILFWHRGLSLSDIALGHALLEKSARTGIGQKLRFRIRSLILAALSYRHPGLEPGSMSIRSTCGGSMDPGSAGRDDEVEI